MVRTLDFHAGRSDPMKGGKFFFSYASFLCYGFHVIRISGTCYQPTFYWHFFFFFGWGRGFHVIRISGTCYQPTFYWHSFFFFLGGGGGGGGGGESVIIFFLKTDEKMLTDQLVFLTIPG